MPDVARNARLGEFLAHRIGFAPQKQGNRFRDVKTRA
jgi:hypothetical protein